MDDHQLPEKTEPDSPRRALIVAESMFGNTRYVAQCISDGFKTTGWHVDIADVASAPSVLTPDLDLLVVGTPTHGFSLHRPNAHPAPGVTVATAELQRVVLLRWLSEVQPTGAWPWLAVYDTRVAEREGSFRSVARRAVDVALDRGFAAVHRPETFLVLDNNGPLASGEVDRAVEWGRTMTTSPKSPAR